MLGPILWDVIAFTAFAILSIPFACDLDQPRLRRDGLVTDIAYLLISLTFYGALGLWSGRAALAGAHLLGWRSEAAWPARLPVWGQALLAAVLFDAAQYGLHRLFHGRSLWRFHEVHHSAKHIDSLTSFRVHPFNYLVYAVLPLSLLLTVGFSPAAFLMLAPFNFAMAMLTHANLRWTYGPFRYVLASPIFHRWHHANPLPSDQGCNFAPNFPVLDLVFGTFHMPRTERPSNYGAPEAPDDIVGQMLHPFRTAS